MSLKNIITESYQIIKDELYKSKKLDGPKLAKFKNIYGISNLDGDIYINRFNIVLTSEEDYDNIKYSLREDNIVIKLSIKEYGIGLFIFRRLNDPMLNEVFN